jgi:hypothetical protein
MLGARARVGDADAFAHGRCRRRHDTADGDGENGDDNLGKVHGGRWMDTG